MSKPPVNQPLVVPNSPLADIAQHARHRLSRFVAADRDHCPLQHPDLGRNFCGQRRRLLFFEPQEDPAGGRHCRHAVRRSVRGAGGFADLLERDHSLQQLVLLHRVGLSPEHAGGGRPGFRLQVPGCHHVQQLGRCLARQPDPRCLRSRLSRAVVLLRLLAVLLSRLRAPAGIAGRARLPLDGELPPAPAQTGPGPLREPGDRRFLLVDLQHEAGQLDGRV